MVDKVSPLRCRHSPNLKLDRKIFGDHRVSMPNQSRPGSSVSKLLMQRAARELRASGQPAQ